MPEVSVIVPNYNHEKFLKQRLDSIFNQTFQDFEVIILDDCSTDNSREIIEQFRNHPKVSKIEYNTKNEKSPFKQWKKGIEFSKGKLIWIAESDDWSELNFLEKAVPCFDDENVSIVVSSVRLVFESMNNYQQDISFDDKKENGIDFIRTKMLGKCGIQNVGMVVFRKDIYSNFKDGEWLKFKQAGDWRLYIDLISNSKIVSINELLSYCRIHKTNFTSLNRKNGMDFLEGLEVYDYARTLCDKKYNKILVYNQWLQSYFYFSGFFEKGIRKKVFIKMIKTDMLLFFYFIVNFYTYKIARKFRKLFNNI